MKIRELGIGAISLGLMVAVAQGEPGKGLGKEYKSQYTPLSQQSGWGIKPESAEIQTTKMEESKLAAQTAPVATPADSDLDGVIDQQDRCAGTAAGIKVDANGCPMEAKAVPEKEWRLSAVQFETGSDRLKLEGRASLDEAAEILTTHTRVVVEIQGHTDSVGDPMINQALSEKRAVAVRKYLADKGVPTQRLEVRGYGETKPVANNETVDGRAQNRRIEFIVLNEE